MTDPPKVEEDVIHRLKNDLAIIVGFCDLLVAECPASDPRLADLREVHRAAEDALSVLPEVIRRTRLASGKINEVK